MIYFFFSCGNRQSCEVEVSRSVFEDPCPDTFKYLEAHYTCQARFTTTTEAHAQPPWLLDLAATPPPPPREIPTTTTTTTSTTTATTTTTTAVVAAAVPGGSDDGRHGGFSGSFDHLAAGNLTDNGDDRLLVSVLLEDGDNCRPVSVRGLFWNWTRAGQLAVQTCPPGSRGFAKWRCGDAAKNGGGAAANWYTGSPDLSECESSWLTRLRSGLREDGRTGREILEAARELADSTADRPLYGGDMALVGDTVAELNRRARKVLSPRTTRGDGDDRYHHHGDDNDDVLLEQVVEHLVMTGSNLLQDGQQMLGWSDLAPADRARAGTSLLSALEETVRLAADAVNKETRRTIDRDNVRVDFRVLKSRDLSDQAFVGGLNGLGSASVAVRLPSRAVLPLAINGAVRLLFFHYNNMDHVLPSSTNGVKFLNSNVGGAAAVVRRHDDGRYRQQQHGVAFADYYSDDRRAAVAVEGTSVLPLSEPMTLTFLHVETAARMHSPSCVWWDFEARTWSEAGCAVAATNDTHTECRCDHLAPLAAVLMEEEGEDLAGARNTGMTATATSSTMTVIIAAAASVAICVVTVAATAIIFRRFGGRTKSLCPRRGGSPSSWPCMDHHRRAGGGGGGGVAAVGGDRSGAGSGGNGYYPYLSSSTTTTTLTPGTPGADHHHHHHNHADGLVGGNGGSGGGGANGGQYCMASDCQVLRPLMITPVGGPNSTIYRATFANGQQAHVIPISNGSTATTTSNAAAAAGAMQHQQHPAGNKAGGNFRPITPSASHIYMEIDPVYNSETMSDILVSDLSDDDLRAAGARAAAPS